MLQIPLIYRVANDLASVFPGKEGKRGNKTYHCGQGAKMAWVINIPSFKLVASDATGSSVI